MRRKNSGNHSRVNLYQCLCVVLFRDRCGEVYAKGNSHHIQPRQRGETGIAPCKNGSSRLEESVLRLVWKAFGTQMVFPHPAL